MPQTFYIESDEEIISVIGRLRKSGSEENYFVFPKRALVLQSIVNLRLFQREAQKIGKKIIVVSQDEVGRMLAEKAGLETENYSEDFSKSATHVELSVPPQEAPEEPVSPAAKGPEEVLLRSDMIGSSDFYTPRQEAPLAPPVAPPVSRQPVSEPRSLRIRNASPDKSPSLNSQRSMNEFSQRQAPERYAPVTPVAPEPSVIMEEPIRMSASMPARDERLKNFFSNATPVRPTPPAAPSVAKKPRTDVRPPVAGKKVKMIFFFLGGLSLISLLGAALFLFLPKAEIVVTPHKMTQNVDLQFDGRTGDVSSGNNVIAVRLIEKEQSVSVSGEVTGKSGGLNQKARGTVVLYNSYSADPQPLVATTRLETTDGKLFRLVEGVTIPGMTTSGGKSEPGAIEAKVIADQAGDAYNIDATTFTIPGFKGSPKYGKFSAKSVKAFTGGGSGGSDISVVSKADLDKAESDAKEKAKNDFLETQRGTLATDEKILEEVMEITPVAAAVLPQVGTAASSFEYSNAFKIRAFIFSEKDIKEKAEDTNTTKIQEIVFKPVAISLSYSESLPNYTEGSVRIRAHAVIVSESDIDQEQFRTALLGQDENGIQGILGNFPEIKKIEVNFEPQWFVSTIPKSESRVSIVVQPGEE